MVQGPIKIAPPPIQHCYKVRAIADNASESLRYLRGSLGTYVIADCDGIRPFETSQTLCHINRVRGGIHLDCRCYDHTVSEGHLRAI